MGLHPFDDDEDYYCFRDDFNEYGSFVQREIVTKGKSREDAEKAATKENLRVLGLREVEPGHCEIGIGQDVSDEDILYTTGKSCGDYLT